MQEQSTSALSSISPTAPLEKARLSLKLAGFPVILYNPRRKEDATVAQLVEQTIRNRQVMGSNPIGGSLGKAVFLSTKPIQRGKTAIFLAEVITRRSLKIHGEIIKCLIGF